MEFGITPFICDLKISVLPECNQAEKGPLWISLFRDCLMLGESEYGREQGSVWFRS